MVVPLFFESACCSAVLILVHNRFTRTLYCTYCSFYPTKGANGSLSFDLEEMPQVILLFYAAGVLWVKAPLDFELCREYYLSVEGTRGKASLSDIAMVIINITDINDNPPVFSRGDYSAEIAENLSPGDTVMQVSLRGSLTCQCCLTITLSNELRANGLPAPTCLSLMPLDLVTVTYT